MITDAQLAARKAFVMAGHPPFSGMAEMELIEALEAARRRIVELDPYREKYMRLRALIKALSLTLDSVHLIEKAVDDPQVREEQLRALREGPWVG